VALPKLEIVTKSIMFELADGSIPPAQQPLCVSEKAAANLLACVRSPKSTQLPSDP